MSLNNMVVYNNFAYTTMTELLRQNIELFNAATGGSMRIVQAGARNRGDFTDEAFYTLLPDLIRARNPYGSGNITDQEVFQDEMTTVKVGRGTNRLKYTTTQFRWINRNPEEAGVIFGRQLAQQMMTEYVNLALGVVRVALLNDSATNQLDVTGRPAPDDEPDFQNMTEAAALFGDKSAEIQTWIMHSTPMNKIWIDSLKNVERLFQFGNVIVMRDPFGRRMIQTDSPNLVDTVTTPGTPIYHIVGLTQGGITIEENGDFDQANEKVTGNENITHYYQNEWSFNVGVKGYSWDKSAGNAPTDAALLTSNNWLNKRASHKDLPGVLLEVH